MPREGSQGTRPGLRSTALPAETAGKRRSLGEGEAAELSGSPEVLRPEAAEERGSQVLR